MLELYIPSGGSLKVNFPMGKLSNTLSHGKVESQLIIKNRKDESWVGKLMTHKEQEEMSHAEPYCGKMQMLKFP